MQFEVPDPDLPLDESWTRPLAAIAASVVGDPRYQFFDPHDFMVMAKIVRKSRPDIVEYKHVHTRAYLHLDDAGGVYRYVPPADISKGSGRYVAHQSVEAALDDVGMWQLPWMKPGLEKYRFGFDWNERWMLHPDVIPIALNPKLGDEASDEEDGWLDVCDEMYRRDAQRAAHATNEAYPRLSLVRPSSHSAGNDYE